MGVITTGSLSDGTVFGPISTTLTLADPAVLIGHRTCDTLPDIHTVKLNVTDHSESNRLSEWVPYVQAARDSVEQNMEAFLEDGQLYFRITRHVAENSELLIWYSPRFASHLGVPELKEEYQKGDAFFCPRCRDSFLFPNCLRAHMRFRCKFKHQQQQQQPPPTHHPLSRLTSTDQSPGAAAVNPSTDNIPADSLRGGGGGGGGGGEGGGAFDISWAQFASSSEGLSGGADRSSPSSSRSPLASGQSSALRLVKRKPDSCEDLSVLSQKRCASSSILLSSPSPNGSVHSPFDPEPRSRFERPPEVYDERTKSAFQRVDKLPPSTASKLSSALPSYATMTSSILTPTSALNMAAMMDKGVGGGGGAGTSSAAAAAAAMMAAAAGGMLVFPPFPRRFPPLPLPPAPPSASSDAAAIMHRLPQRPTAAIVAANENNAPYYAAAAAAVAAAAANAAAMTGLGYMNNNNNNNINNNNNNTTTTKGLKGLLAPSSYISADPGRLGLPFFYRSPNPMVDKMLHVTSGPIPSTFTALNLTQNWCAKCNTSFRMTSDLVYHMRSHHKREFDPVKKKKDDKLKCDVCGESFRERHHLTRHMTSHT